MTGSNEILFWFFQLFLFATFPWWLCGVVSGKVTTSYYHYFKGPLAGVNAEPYPNNASRYHMI